MVLAKNYFTDCDGRSKPPPSKAPKIPASGQKWLLSWMIPTDHRSSLVKFIFNLTETDTTVTVHEIAHNSHRITTDCSDTDFGVQRAVSGESLEVFTPWKQPPALHKNSLETGEEQPQSASGLNRMILLEWAAHLRSSGGKGCDRIDFPGSQIGGNEKTKESNPHKSCLYYRNDETGIT